MAAHAQMNGLKAVKPVVEKTLTGVKPQLDAAIDAGGRVRGLPLCLDHTHSSPSLSLSRV